MIEFVFVIQGHLQLMMTFHPSIFLDQLLFLCLDMQIMIVKGNYKIALLNSLILTKWHLDVVNFDLEQLLCVLVSNNYTLLSFITKSLRTIQKY